MDTRGDTEGQRTDVGQGVQRMTWLAPRLLRMGSVTEWTRTVNNKGQIDNGTVPGHSRT